MNVCFDLQAGEVWGIAGGIVSALVMVAIAGYKIGTHFGTQSEKTRWLEKDHDHSQLRLPVSPVPSLTQPFSSTDSTTDARKTSTLIGSTRKKTK